MSADLFFISRLIILLATMLGILAYRQSAVFYKYLFAHVFIALVIETLAHFLVFGHKGIYNSTPLYNLFILTDIPILIYAAGRILKLKYNNTITATSIGVYVAAWCTHTFINGIDSFANWPFVLGSILLCAFYLTLIVEQYAFQKDISLRSPVVWAAAAIIIYYASNVPTFSFLKLLSSYDIYIAKKMYSINVLLSIVHYICLGITFYLLRPSSPKAPTT